MQHISRWLTNKKLATIGVMKKGANKEQNATYKEHNRAKKDQNWGVVFHENTSSKIKFSSKGAESF